MNILNTNPYFVEHKNLNDLVNGVALTITSANRNFDYTEAYLLLPEILKVFYSSIDTKPYALTTKIKPPTEKEIETSLIMNQLIAIFCIAPNENQVNHHIHSFVYGLHNFTGDANNWTSFVNSELKKLNPISSKNKYSVKMRPITDNIDKAVRDQNSYKPLVEYITNPEYDSWIHYLIYKNNKQLIYHYS
jgi:hypothetical protein